uniref:Remorin C-terminal domain-containing protein n=1 Tax=Ananas comosus var. bracteatus TaxID=296719 RepID=A0A6V7PWP8_ANACO|nr:unnamed protein product [Ananas comosus var. bracteatus]
MEYERIHKPLHRQSGGFSPAKLRAVLLGLEKRRKGEEASEEEEEEEEQGEVEFDMELDDRRRGGGELGIGVGASAAERCRDVECSTSTGVQQRSIQSRIRVLDSETGDSEWSFDFHRAPPPPRSPIAPPFSRPAPSKWDDAEKWIASPTSHRGGRAPAWAGKRSGLGVPMATASAAAKVVVSAAAAAKDSPKWAGATQGKKDGGGLLKAVNWAPEAKPLPDSAICLSQHDTSASARSASTFITPAPTVRSVSMRDMGTEMTPIASQEPSRTGTPLTIRSPTSSRPPTPPRTLPSSVSCDGDSNNKELSEMELQKKTRREIMVLGQQLGKTNIAAWASKEEEEANASNNGTLDQSAKIITEARAAAWEEAEKAKYLSSLLFLVLDIMKFRFKQEEIKIQAWENHQKAKTEAKMRKIEVEVERMRAREHERLMNKLAAANHKAEEMRAAAEAKRNNQASRTAQQAEYIRRTGRVPSSFSFWNWCL